MEAITLTVDVRVEGFGSIILLQPLTPDAWAWFDEYLICPTWYSGAVVCEPRYADAVVAGLRDDGLVVV